MLPAHRGGFDPKSVESRILIRILENEYGDSVAEQTDAISVIVPVYNEAESLPELHRELLAALERTSHPFEIVYVNDGSTDPSGDALDRISQGDDRVTVLHFRRNFGQTAAVAAGIDHATGSLIVPIDGDLQNDPADIPALIAKLKEGYDVVSGWRKHRKDNSFTRTLPSRIANGLISTISGVRLHDYGCTLKVYRREVIEGVRLYGEMHRFIPIYAAMEGGKVTEMPVNHRPRRFGKSKYGLNRIFKVLLDLLLVKFLASYSAKPIYIFGGFGLFCLAFSVVPIGMAVFFKFNTIPGWQKDFVTTPLPVIAAVFILVGFLAVLQGLLAEVLMRTYFESQGKKIYLIKSIRRGGTN